MNTHLLAKTKRLAVKTVVSMCILIALTGMITPLTAFACTQAEFATILKGFCQAFKADLQRGQGVTNRELKRIVNGNSSVKDILENSKHNLSDSDVLTFETSEINIANSDFDAGTTYAPDACGLGTTRDIATDKNDFQIYFNGSEYSTIKSDIDTIDQLFSDAVRAAGGTTSNTFNNSSTTNNRTDNVVEPKFSERHNVDPQRCTDTLVKGDFDSSTNTTFYLLTTGSAPAFCHDRVTWNFTNRTVGKDCTFYIKNPDNRSFTLNFIESDGVKHPYSTSSFLGLATSTQQNDIKQVQLDFSTLANVTNLQIGGIWYNCQ